MSEDEKFGAPHTLIVRSVQPPAGQFDDGEIEYDLEHPPACKQEEMNWHGVPGLEWTCDVAHQEREAGLASSLHYSGTPITEPGTYRIQGWSRKYWTQLGYEYDSAVGVIDDGGTA